MPDPIPNPVVPSNFDTLAAGAMASARSPLEREIESAPPLQGNAASPVDDPAASHNAPDHQRFSSQLDKFRAQDAGKQVAAPAAAPAPDAPADPSTKSPIEHRRLNGHQAQRRAQWNAVNSTREQALARVQELEAQLQQRAGGTAPNPAGAQPQAGAQAPTADLARLPLDQLISSNPELKRLKEERDTFYEEIKHVRVEADPEFKAKFDSRRDAAIGIAKRSAGGAADDVAKILSMGDADARRTALAERLSSGNFSDASKAKIAAAVASLDALDVEREMEIASRKATWDSTQASRQQRQQMQQQQRFSQLEREFDDVVRQWADPEKGMPFVHNDPQRIVADAKRIFSGETEPRALAEAAMKASVLPDVLQGWNSALDEVTRLREQVALLTGAMPMDNGGSYVPPSSAPAQFSGHTAPGHVEQFASGLEAARAADFLRTYGGGR